MDKKTAQDQPSSKESVPASTSEKYGRVIITIEFPIEETKKFDPTVPAPVALNNFAQLMEQDFKKDFASHPKASCNVATSIFTR